METTSDKIFSRQVPDEWLYRKIELDYGLDREIEIAINGKLTGKTLLIQLKSSATIRKEDNLVKYSIETNKLQYYLERDVPVILILVDIQKEICYWLFVQEYIFENLNSKKLFWRKQKTVTIEIPMMNIWFNSIEKIKDIAIGGVFYLIVKKLSNISTETILKWKNPKESIDFWEDFKKQIQSKENEIDLDLSYKYGKEGMDQKSFDKLITLYNNPKITPINKLKTIDALISYCNPTDKSENHRLFELAKEGYQIAVEYGNKPYSIYFNGVLLQTIYFTKVIDLSNQLLIQKVTQKSKGGYDFLVGISVQETWLTLIKIVSDFRLNIIEIEKEKQYVIYTELLRRFALMNLFLYNRLIVWIDEKEITDLLVTAGDHLQLSFMIADYMKWDELKCITFLDIALVYHYRNDTDNNIKSLKQALVIAKRIGHKGLIKKIENIKIFFKKRAHFITGPKDIPKSTKTDFEKLKDKEIDEIHRRLLEAGGIDINGNDEMAMLARIGLKDRNPERILRYCENLHTEIVNYGPIWNMVALKTTGTKLLFCENKEKFLVGNKLDDILNEFKKENCSGCNSHSPRPKNWKWTYRWQRERRQPEKMKQILKKCRQWY